MSPEGRLAHVNATLSQWLRLRPELTRETGRPLTLLDIVSGDGAALIRAVGRTPPGRTTRLELDLLREDGRAFPAQLICRSHGPQGIISVLVLDRGEELTRAAARAHSELRLTRVFQSAPFGIATADTGGRIVTANAAFMRMFAIEGRGVPATVAALVPEGEEEAGRELAKAVERAVSGRTGAAPIEVSFGSQREMARRIYVSTLNAGPRGREGAVLYAIDATEQKALELKFAQSHKMEAVGKLAGGVAHDFNNVLTAIIGFSDLLLQTHRQTDPSYRDIMNIRSSAHRAAALVRQLLAFSRRQTLQAEVLELGEVLTDLSALLNRAMGEKIELKILPGRDLWYVKADKTQFEQVIINLAVNARDAMPDGGCVTIRTRNLSERESLKHADHGVAAGEYVLIEVEDTGVGMAEEVKAKIFEPFFSTKEVGKGTGLGLSTAYGIVKQTGGYIFADSEVDKGTTFRIYLPRHIVENEDEIAQPREKKRESARDLTGSGRVLLVEDEDVVRNFAARALVAPGLRGAGGRHRRGGARGGGAREGPDRHRRQRRHHAGDGRTDAAQGAAQDDPGAQVHLRLGLSRRRLQEEPGRERGLCFPAQALHPAATRRQGEGAAGAMTCRLGRAKRRPNLGPVSFACWAIAPLDPTYAILAAEPCACRRPSRAF